MLRICTLTVNTLTTDTTHNINTTLTMDTRSTKNTTLATDTTLSIYTILVMDTMLLIPPRVTASFLSVFLKII